MASEINKEGWKANTGRKPVGDDKRRARIILAKDLATMTEQKYPEGAPRGWNVKTSRWSLTGSEYDIARYILL